MQTERFGQPGNRDAGAARKAAEEVQLVRSGQSLEGPETGRKAPSAGRRKEAPALWQSAGRLHAWWGLSAKADWS
jgi:hypothetical protein